MEMLEQSLEQLAGLIWGIPLVILLAGSGLYFTLRLRLVQFRGFAHAIQVIRGKYDNPSDPGQINHFQALTTALSATVGLGNIAGVAVAIKAGGPGAVFWMMLMGLLGMATKFSECSLAMMYRKIDDKGEVHGGPMYYIHRGLGEKWKPLASFFAFAAICATFGGGNMFQSNQVASIMEGNFSIPPIVTGIVLAVMTGAVIIGGIRRIGAVTSKLVPLMGAIYVIGSLIVIFSNASQIPSLFLHIFKDAFTGTAAIGGFSGAVIREVIGQGVRRACFSNEAGLGTAPIAHSAACTSEPIREGVVALLEPFIDTVVICSMTALVILISGTWTTDLNGVELTAAAFNTAIPGFGTFFVPVAVFLFAYSTLLSWSYYGERALDYLSPTDTSSTKNILMYKVIFCVVTFIGSVWAIGPVLNFSDIMLGIMAVPNLLAVHLLFKKLKTSHDKYFEDFKAGRFQEYF